MTIGFEFYCLEDDENKVTDYLGICIERKVEKPPIILNHSISNINSTILECNMKFDAITSQYHCIESFNKPMFDSLSALISTVAKEKCTIFGIYLSKELVAEQLRDTYVAKQCLQNKHAIQI